MLARPQMIRIALLLCLGAYGIVSAQSPDPTIQWMVTVKSDAAVRRGGTAIVVLSAEIQDGWHIYALDQPSGGPVALRVSVDDNGIARVVGTPSGTKPLQRHDPSFDLETRVYTHAFYLQLPLQVKPDSELGRQLIPISVHFQSCSERECRPPKTVRFEAPLDVTPES
jgi:hypothetical protein